MYRMYSSGVIASLLTLRGSRDGCHRLIIDSSSTREETPCEGPSSPAVGRVKGQRRTQQGLIWDQGLRVPTMLPRTLRQRKRRRTVDGQYRKEEVYPGGYREVYPGGYREEAPRPLLTLKTVLNEAPEAS